MIGWNRSWTKLWRISTRIWSFDRFVTTKIILSAWFPEATRQERFRNLFRKHLETVGMTNTSGCRSRQRTSFPCWMTVVITLWSKGKITFQWVYVWEFKYLVAVLKMGTQIIMGWFHRSGRFFNSVSQAGVSNYRNILKPFDDIWWPKLPYKFKRGLSPPVGVPCWKLTFLIAVVKAVFGPVL